MRSLLHKAIIIWFVSYTYTTAKHEFPKKMIITAPVANLRNAPEGILNPITLPTSMKTNPLQASQLLLGEHITAHKEIINGQAERWLKVSATQQQRYNEKSGWHGFPGWIRADQAIPIIQYPQNNLIVKKAIAPLLSSLGKHICKLSIGTRLHGIKKLTDHWEVLLPDNRTAFIKHNDVYEFSKTITETTQDIRQNLVATARTFLTNFYSWGGRSTQNNEWDVSSVDCSSLVQLVYLSNGFELPRNAHDQFLLSHTIDHGKDLQPGDLVFFDPVDYKKNYPIRMTHVLLYIGNDNLLEATNSGERKVRIIDFEKRIGVPRISMKAGDVSRNVTTKGKIAGQYRIYFGSYCKDKKLLQHVRDIAL